MTKQEANFINEMSYFEKWQESLRKAEALEEAAEEEEAYYVRRFATDMYNRYKELQRERLNA